MTRLSDLAPRIVVLCGSLRAGTTLTRVMLGEHSRITGRGESDYLFENVTAEGLRTGGSDKQRRDLRERIGADRVPAGQGIAPPEIGPLGDMVATMIEQLMPSDGRLLLTLHRHVDVAAAALPGAAFVHLKRDPRDVAISSMKMGWAGVPYHGVDVWRQAERDWRAAAQRVVGPKTEFAFEELTSDTEGTLRRVFEAIDLPFDTGILSPPRTSTYDAPTAARNYAWRDTLTTREASEIDWRIADVPDDGTYPRTPRKPSAVRRLELAVRNKAGRQRFWIERYGLPLYLAERVARRLRLPGRKRLQERTLAIDLARLK